MGAAYCLVHKPTYWYMPGCDISTCIYPGLLLKVRARALMYLNHSGYKLQHHPLTHLSDILMIEVLSWNIQFLTVAEFFLCRAAEHLAKH